MFPSPRHRLARLLLPAASLLPSLLPATAAEQVPALYADDGQEARHISFSLLGTRRLGGHGSPATPKNMETAFGWNLKAARNGHEGARKRVAKACRNGEGTRSSKEKALYWERESARGK